jgi:hypothetical protein
MNVMRNLILAGLIGLALAVPAVDAKPRDREQDEAFRGTHDGRLVPLRVIESRIIPQMRGYDYLGPELDAAAARYRLKFIKGPQVVWVDVDARTGEIIARSDR